MNQESLEQVLPGKLKVPWRHTGEVLKSVKQGLQSFLELILLKMKWNQKELRAKQFRAKQAEQEVFQINLRLNMEQDPRQYLQPCSTATDVRCRNSMVLLRLFQKFKMIKEEPSQPLSHSLRNTGWNLKWWTQFAIKYSDMIQDEPTQCQEKSSEKFTNISA